MQTLAAVGAIAGFVVFFGGIIAFLVRHKMKINATWRGFAAAHNLKLSDGPYPSVTGDVGGRTFEMGVGIGRNAAGRAQMNRVVEFGVLVHVHGAVPAGLVAGKRGRFQAAGNVDLGGDKLWIECPDVAAATAYFTPARLAGLRQVADLGAVLLGPKDGQPARISRVQTGYTVKPAWFEAQRAAFVGAATALDA